MNSMRVIGMIAASWSLTAAAAELVTPEGRRLPLAPKPCVLAKDGKALVPIRIATNATAELRATASNLTATLSRMTGADFAIVEGGGADALTLGTLAQFHDASLAETLASGPNATEAYAIRCDEKGARLLANTDLGASHAAHRFLELLGCRWFFQHPAWIVVPKIDKLEAGFSETARPDIGSRTIWFARTAQAWEKGDPDANALFAQWRRGNRMGESFTVNASHAWHAIPAAFKDDGYPFKAEFEAHPEYFALVDGQRKPPQLCVSNTNLQQAVIRYVNHCFEKNPDAQMVSLDPADQGGWCACDACAKLGPYPAQPFILANLAAKALQASHPGRMIGLLAYSWHSDPPPFTLEPNVYVQLTAGMNASKLPFTELFAQWAKQCRNLGIYEYYSYWETDECMLPGSGPQSHLDSLAPRMRNYVSNRVSSISGQAANNWGANGLGYYLAARLMWDASSDTRALLVDFYDKAFGPAAAPMARYYGRLNLDTKPMPGAALLRQCLDDLEEATRLAADRPDVLARLVQLKENLVYNGIGLKVRTGGALTYEDNLLDWFTWSYRTRTNYLYDWISFRSNMGREAEEKHGIPNFFWRSTTDNPWRDETPVSAQDVEKRLEELKQEWGELPKTAPRAFSNRFVLARTGRPQAGDRKNIHSGKATYLLASTNGEALRFSVTKRDTGWIEKPDMKWSLEAQDGTVVTNGALATGRHDLALAVPKAGLYRFTCLRGGKGWEVEFPPDLKAALVFERGEPCNPTAYRDAWFYVPKKATAVVMYTVAPSSPVVRAPGGRVARKGPSLGQFLELPVQAGEAGKLWGISGRPSNLWFFNVPTVVQYNADAIVVPEDLAEEDGLEVILR